ncbi:FAD/NAD(P)-binding domain-containing protein [Gymnopus androsaceus JB14]|uniref:FAD/NAD(P)-binding domain-containing protein n=1 Tax=Gymnopus androsaceus JB14 TaxID=1447944 RepID=A0A6A4HWG0_9AGAR|nr:FAD/NAD(P)-binding domain-containing protein [Gymnopus androsaceus JB14]
MNTNLRVAICGAGIGGLTLALALSRFPNIDVSIYESAQALAEIGAGIGVFPRVWRVIQKLGLDEDLLKTFAGGRQEGPVVNWVFRKSNQAEGEEFFSLVAEGSVVFLHRPDYQKTIINHLPDRIQTYTSKRLVSYTQSSGGPPLAVQLCFADGTTASCDILVGADGLKSSVRAGVLRERAQDVKDLKAEAELRYSLEPVWAGTNAYRALISVDKLRERAPGHRLLSATAGIMYLGKSAHILAYRISEGRMINFVAFVSKHELENTEYDGPWMSIINRGADPEAFKNAFSAFEGWEEDVQAMIDCIVNPIDWAIHTVLPMSSFISGQVVLLGDAAHAMTPHQGSGAGQAVEDAYILATVLGQISSREDIQRALSVYDAVRRPFALEVMERSRRNGRYLQLTFDLPGLLPTQVGSEDSQKLELLEESERKEKLAEIGAALGKNWGWAWNTSLDGAVQEALRLMEQYGGKEEGQDE